MLGVEIPALTETTIEGMKGAAVEIGLKGNI